MAACGVVGARMTGTRSRKTDSGAAAAYQGGPLELPTIAAKDREWWAFRQPVRSNRIVQVVATAAKALA